MSTPYDGKIGAWFWEGSTVAEKTIDLFLDMLEAETPNVRAIFVKSNNGTVWQGNNDAITSEMNIFGPQDIDRWVKKCAQHKFDLHLWCVVKGSSPDAEINTITSACLVPGIKSMIFDLEVGDKYYIGGRDNARKIASEVRRRVADDLHLSVCLDGRNNHPKDVFFDEWLPYTNSIQPMIYYDSFFPSLTDFDDVAKSSTDAIFKNLASYNRPILPIFPSRPNVKDTMLDIANFAINRYDVSSYSLWRLGPALYGKVLKTIKQLPLPGVSADPETVYTNQQIIDAISKASISTNNDPKDWLHRADLSHLIDNRGGQYLGADILQLPGLADDQRQLILMALLGMPLPAEVSPVPIAGGPVEMDPGVSAPAITNQKIINAFLAAAQALGDPDAVWQWFAKAKLNAILGRTVRNNPYTGSAIADLPGLSDEIKTKIEFYRNLDQSHPVTAGTETRRTGVALRGANIDLGDGRFSPADLAPFTCCRLKYDMSMETGSTDFARAEARYHSKISGYISAKVTPIVIVNHEFFGEGQGFDWIQMREDSDAVHNRWKDLTDKFVIHLKKLAAVYTDQIVYEIWNETDNKSDASVYVPERSFAYLLDKSLETIHAISPNARVIVGGLVSGNAQYWHNTRKQMQHESALAGIGIHPYGQEDNGKSLVALLNTYASGSNTSFWLTEWGVLGDASKSEPPPVPENTVATYAERFINTAKSDKRVAAIIWYGYADGMHNGYGLVLKDGTTRKPKLWAAYTKGL